jgi:hypothetical protein
MTSAQKSHGNARSKTLLQMLIEEIARGSATQSWPSSVPRCLCDKPPQNQKSSFTEIFPFKAIQRDSKAFKAIQRFFRKKRLFIFSREASVGPSGAHRPPLQELLLRAFVPRHASLVVQFSHLCSICGSKLHVQEVMFTAARYCYALSAVFLFFRLI